MLGESDGTTGDATIEQIGRRRTLTWAYGIATHPLEDGEEKPYKTEIFFVKAVLAGHLDWDLEQYAFEHTDFPRCTTGDQFYNEWDFEAYRSLGYTTTQSLTDHTRPTPVSSICNTTSR